MPFYDYHFITHWKIIGPIQNIYDILKDGPRYSVWWKPAYVRSDSKGHEVVCAVRAKLPYTLTFTTQLVCENPPNEISIRSRGELKGTGVWKLTQDGDVTHVQFYWDVQVTKLWVRWLSLFLKPIFKWNHDWVMKIGEKRLQEEVLRSQATRLFSRDG